MVHTYMCIYSMLVLVLLESYSAFQATVVIASPQHVPGLNHDTDPQQPHIVELPVSDQLARDRGLI